MFATLTILELLFYAALATVGVHPHEPKALVLQGAGGKLTVTYQTVPYNAERLRSIEPGFVWHLGFATLDTEVALRSGEVDVPAGRYSLGARRGEEGGDWEPVLTPFELVRAQAALRSAQRRGEGIEEARAGLAAIEVELGDRGVPTSIPLESRPRSAPHDAHLEIAVLFGGYNTQTRGSVEPTGGMGLTLRIGFGDLHRDVPLVEVFGQ
jgi:hypothetical protein